MATTENETNSNIDNQITTDTSDTLHNKQGIPFFHVSINKLIIMSVVTMGLYTLYWFYKQWKEIKIYYQLDIWPIPRAIFALFFTHSLFRYIDGYLDENQREYKWQGSSSATLYVWIIILSFFTNYFSENFEMPLFWIITLMAISLLLNLLAIIPIVRAQKVINFILLPFGALNNNQITGANIFWLLIGVLSWGLIAMSFFHIHSIYGT